MVLLLIPMNKKSILKGSMRKIIEELHAGTTQRQNIVIRANYIIYYKKNENQRTSQSRNSARDESRLPVALLTRQKACFCLKNHQHLTETNQKTRVLSQKNQKIYTGAEPPLLVYSHNHRIVIASLYYCRYTFFEVLKSFQY